MLWNIILNGGDYGTCYIANKTGDIKQYEISESRKEIIT